MEGPPKQEKAPLLEADLRKLFQLGGMTFGHGTVQGENAEEILKTGLGARVDRLGTTTVPLFDRSRPFEDQVGEVERQILDWGHHHTRFVVILNFPEMPEGVQNPEHYIDSAFEETSDDRPYGRPYRIPPRYVRGYFDSAQKRFIENPTFDPQPITVRGPRISQDFERFPHEEYRGTPAPSDNSTTEDADIF